MNQPYYQSRDRNVDVLAFHYQPGASIPRWVAKSFHDLAGNGVLSHKNGTVLKPGDWVVAVEGEKACMVLTDAEFNTCFVEVTPVKSPDHVKV